MNARLYTLFFPLLLATYTCSAQKNDRWLEWKNAGGSITVSYPKEWTELKLDAGEIVAFAAPKDNAKDRNADMMVLRVFPDSGAKSIDQLMDFARKTLSPQWNFKMASNRKIAVKERSYIKSVAEDEGKKVTLVMYTMLEQDRIFFLTLITEKKNYEKYESMSDAVFNSLVIGAMPLPK